MKNYIILFLLMFLLGCATDTSNQKWLLATQKMIQNGDPIVSTKNIEKIKDLIKWATTNGYTVNVSHTDTVAGYKPDMYFAILKKEFDNFK